MENKTQKIVALVQEAAGDEALAKKLKEQPMEELKSRDLEIPELKNIHFISNEKNLYHLVIPKKPLPEKVQVASIGRDPSLHEIVFWLIGTAQKNPKERKEIIKDPISYLKKHRVEVPSNLNIKVYENTEEDTYFVIPRKHNPNEELSDFDLQLVSGGKGFGGEGEGGGGGLLGGIMAGTVMGFGFHAGGSIFSSLMGGGGAAEGAGILGEAADLAPLALCA